MKKCLCGTDMRFFMNDRQEQIMLKCPSCGRLLLRAYGQDICWYVPGTALIAALLNCLRCGHNWRPKSDKLPKVCPNPKCKSPYWNKPRKEKKEAQCES